MKKNLRAISLGLLALLANPTSSTSHAVNTGLGTIQDTPGALALWVITRGIGVGGGLAFLLSLWGGLTILFSSGNPEKINEGKQIITSAISGLLFIIFSVVILRFIGVDILGIPGWKAS